jgi:hypothetical protein
VLDPYAWGCKERGEFGAAAAGVRNMIGSACRIGRVSRDFGRSTEVVKVVRKLQRVGSNGLYAARNSPSTSYQLAHLTGTTIEFQLRLDLRAQSPSFSSILILDLQVDAQTSPPATGAASSVSC